MCRKEIGASFQKIVTLLLKGANRGLGLCL